MEGSQLTPALVNVLVATPASRGPKRMHCVMDSIPATAIETGDVAPTQTVEFVCSSRSWSMVMGTAMVGATVASATVVGAVVTGWTWKVGSGKGASNSDVSET
ncbi:hypothetical protein JHK85_006726 [Glycine max]|nr:hypothetical protein JHK85_006726 [Glycine max]